MSLKAKLVSVISAFVLILTVAIVSVWAVSQANVTMGGTVGFKADNVYAKISAEITGMEPNPTLPTLTFSEGKDASPVEVIEEWANLSLVFANSNTPIQLEITVENLSDERALYAKIDDQIGVVANLTKTVTSSSQDALGRYIEVPTSSSIAYTITLSPTDPNKSVNGEYRYLMTLVDETEIDNVTANIQVSSNQADLGSVSGSGLYAIGDTATLTATPSSSNTFLVWATSTDPNTMEIVSIDPTYSFEVSQDSPRAYYALFNSTTSTSQTVGDLIYTFYNEAKLASVTDTTSTSVPSGDFTIPSVVSSGENSYKLYSIGNNAFQSCGELTSITIPEGVTSIGGFAFYGCSKLQTVNFEENSNLVSIGSQAFYNCSSLASIAIPEGVTSIGYSAFQNCSDLTSLTLPSTLTSIGSNAFQNCNNLNYYTDSNNNKYLGNQTNNYLVLIDVADTTITEFNFPAGCTFIYSNAFSDCSNLGLISLPDNLISIGDFAFSGCSSLQSITIPEGVISIGMYAFQNCSKLNSVIIPESVTIIDDYAFQGCSVLTSITIPESVTEIGNYVFSDCPNFEEITINGNIAVYAPNYYTAFSNCPNLTKITLGSNVSSLPNNLFGNNNLTNLTEIVVEAGSSLSTALPTYGTWVKDGGSDTQTNFSGAGTYTRTDIQ